MSIRQFRFGVALHTTGSRAEWRAKARRAEDLGYDVLLVPDHLGMAAPFPSLVAAAEATSRPRLGTLVLNTGFYKPALLARDVSSTAQLVEGRLELGLGAGWARDEYEAAELPFPSGGRRIDHLARTMTELRRLLLDDQVGPLGAQRLPLPIMVAGQGDRLLQLAAEHADIVGLAGVVPGKRTGVDDPGEAALAERIAFIRAAAGSRLPAIELNLMIAAVALTTSSEEPDLSIPRQFSPDLSDSEILQLPGVLHGTASEIADTLHRYREQFGLTYFTLTEPSMVDFASVISQLR